MSVVSPARNITALKSCLDIKPYVSYFLVFMDLNYLYFFEYSYIHLKGLK